MTSSIEASPERIWQLLTDAANYTKWNSTLETLEGDISLGGEVKMKVPESPGRTFKVQVKEGTPNEWMLWVDGFAPMFTGKRRFRVGAEGRRDNLLHNERNIDRTDAAHDRGEAAQLRAHL